MKYPVGHAACALTFSLVLLAAATAGHAQIYTAVQVPGASEGLGINNSGTVVGETTNSLPFVYNATTTVLSTFGGPYGMAEAVNDAGTVVGYATNANGLEMAFVYGGGSMNPLFPGAGTASRAGGINSSGTIVGYFANAGGYDHAFSYGNGVTSDLGTLGGPESHAYGVNASGTVVGQSDTTNGAGKHAFSFANGAMTDLGTLGGNPNNPQTNISVATAINDSGTIVGTANTAAFTHAFSYSGGTMTDLGTLGGFASGAMAINSSGSIVGYADTVGDNHAFLCVAGAMVDLNSLVLVPGVVLTSATAINDNGQVLALGRLNGVYVLTPAAGLGTHFIVSAPENAVQGSAVSITVAALDPKNNLASSYNGTARVTSSDPGAVVPATVAFTNGSASFTVTFRAPGSQTVSVTDTGNASITGTSGQIGLPSSFQVTVFGNGATVGVPVHMAVSVNSTVGSASDYSGTVHFTSSDPAAELPPDTQLSDGDGLFSIAFNTPGSQTVTATDTVTPGITGVSPPVPVSGPATHFALSVPASATAGSRISVMVSALDASGNLVTGYSGIVQITSSDPSAVLPGEGSLFLGSAFFSVTLNADGPQTVTATDTANPSMSTTSSAVSVSGVPTHFRVSAPATATAGSPIGVTVTVLDASENVASAYSGSVQLTSSDPAAVLSPGGALTGGVGAFTATLNTAGTETISATDAANPSLVGVSGPISVAAAGPAIASQPSSQAVANGANATFSVGVAGAATYQWTFNGSAISGATGSSLSLDGVQPSESGAYAVIVTGPGGNTTSNSAFLTVTSSAGPTISAQPQSLTVAPGQTVVLSAGVSSGSGTDLVSARAEPLAETTTYKWYLNGSELTDGGGVSGSRTAVLELGNGSVEAGSYSCLVANSSGSSLSQPALVTVAYSSPPGRLINISCRAMVGTGGNILIAGFVVGGTGTSGALAVLARASGPALAAFGVPGLLPDPELQLYNTGSAASLLASNAAWGGAAPISAAATEVGAFAWSVASSRDSALLQNLPEGAYTANISGQSGDSGVALAEVYDATPEGSYTPASPRLINLSARVGVGTGGNVLIAGIVIGGPTAKTVLIRASGPALVPFGVTGTLPDPQLQLFSTAAQNTLLSENAGWGANAQIAAAASSVGAFSWGAAPSNDSAILLTLPPGSYTANVSGESGDTGVALIEVYEVE